MADLYIASPKELIDAKSLLTPSLKPDSEAFSEACALIEACNADCTKVHAVAHRPTPIVLPENERELKFVRPTFSAFKQNFKPSRPQAKKPSARSASEKVFPFWKDFEIGKTNTLIRTMTPSV